MKKLKKIIALIILATPAYLFGQNIAKPEFKSANDRSTILSNIEVTPEFTIVTFEHPATPDGWIQVNQSMYLQDAKGETKYEFIKAENIPLRPEKYYFKDNKPLIFKVYFQKLKEGTKAINIIERALSDEQSRGNIKFLNYFDVSLENSRPE